jgi:hypothetical protein
MFSRRIVDSIIRKGYARFSTKCSFEFKWLSKPDESQRVLFSGEHEELVKFKKNLEKNGFPSAFWSPRHGKSQLEVWNNNAVFLKKLDQIAQQTKNAEQTVGEANQPSTSFSK